MTTAGAYEAAPGPDLRANAFVGAWERIEAAQKLKLDPKSKGRVRDPLPELYWSTLAEAAVLADLARADEDPGRDAGRYLLERQKRIEEQQARIRGAVDRANAAQPNPTGGTEAGRGVPSFDNGDEDQGAEQ